MNLYFVSFFVGDKNLNNFKTIQYRSEKRVGSKQNLEDAKAEIAKQYNLDDVTIKSTWKYDPYDF